MGLDRDRLAEVAAATCSAARRSRRSRRETAPAAQNPTRPAAANAIAPAIRIWRRISATLSSTSSSGFESTATHCVAPSISTGTAEAPTRSPAIVSTRELMRPSSTAFAAAS